MRHRLINHIKKYIFTYSITVLFALALTTSLFFHEMYADEIQAWAIAESSDTLKKLIQNLNHENNPGSWHLILFILTRISSSPMILKFTNATIMILAIYLLNRFSHLSKIEKILTSFGYFLLYEYGTISRFYSLTVLLLFAVCALYKYRLRYLNLLCYLLFLLAVTSPYGAIISSTFLIVLIVEDVTILFDKNQKIDTPCRSCKTSLYSIVIIGVFLCILLSIPPSDNLRGNFVDVSQYDKNRFVIAISDIWESYVPIPKRTLTFWNSNFLDEDLRFGFAFVVMIFTVAFFRNNKRVFLFYSVGTLLITLFTYTQFSGLIRHTGHLFLIFISALWLKRSESATRNDTFLSNSFLLSILTVQTFSMLFAFFMDVQFDFAAAKSVSKYIRENVSNDYYLVGDVEPISINVAQYLKKDMYFPHDEKIFSFVIWRKTTSQDKTPKDFVTDVIDKYANYKGDIFFVMYNPLSLDTERLPLEYLSYFGPTITKHNLYLYRLIR